MVARNAGPAAKADAAAVARRLHEVTDRLRLAFEVTAAAHGLTAPQARLILRLIEPTAMRELSEHLACDKSNVTGIAARLSERGLVVHAPGADRRFKLLALTDEGRSLRAALQLAISETSPAMTRLTASERIALMALLDKLAP